jgi:uncharacterized protein (UPF0335 family)
LEGCGGPRPLNDGFIGAAGAALTQLEDVNMAIGTNTVDGISLRSFIERIENLNEEKKAIADDIKDVFGEAKGVGFDPKIMKRIIASRKMDKAKRQEEEEILDCYLSALGMLD